ncbi:MAG: hypothetical protein OER97_08845 [Gammaproteobacteria bacterium]|nr:hypothetical protein [Gammaproteobacteria bacterium]
MQTLQAAKIRAMLGNAGAAALLLGFSVPALAASGVDNLCDRDDKQSASLDVPAGHLTIQTIDHGNTNAVAADDLKAADDASLTELTLTGIDEDSAEILETEEANVAGDENGPPTANTRFPGVSDEDSRRYRRQMFRTDI